MGPIEEPTRSDQPAVPAQETSASVPPRADPGARAKRDNGAPGRDPLDFDLDDAVIRRITGRDTTRLRRLSPVRAVRRDGLDPTVLGALDRLDAKYRALEDRSDARRVLSASYLNEVEAVTRSLNAQSLPRTTRLLLGVDGLYETLLLRAIQAGVGAAPDERREAGEPDHEKH